MILVPVPEKTTFYDDFVRTLVTLLFAFAIAGIILGLIFSEEARIALAIVVIFIGLVVFLTMVKRARQDDEWLK